jgi:hypothetical protein
MGWDYVHSIVDDCSRLAYSEVLDGERVDTVTAFVRGGLDWLLEHGYRGRAAAIYGCFFYVKAKRL